MAIKETKPDNWVAFIIITVLGAIIIGTVGILIANPWDVDITEKSVGTIIRITKGEPYQRINAIDYLYTIKLYDGRNVQYLDALSTIQRFYLGDTVRVWNQNAEGIYTGAELVDCE